MTDPHLALLEAAYDKAVKAAKKKPTKKAIEDLAAAEKALHAYQARLSAEAGAPDAPLANLLEVLDYLKAQGYKVGKSKIYEDQRLIERQEDGTFTREAADKYARLVALPRLDGTDVFDPSGSAAYNEYMKWRALREKEALDKARRENETAARRLVLRSEVEQKHANKLARLITAFENLVYSGPLDEAIEIVNGDMDKLGDLQDFLLARFRAILAEYAKAPRFTVPRKKVVEAQEMMGIDE